MWKQLIEKDATFDSKVYFLLTLQSINNEFLLQSGDVIQNIFN